MAAKSKTPQPAKEPEASPAVETAYFELQEDVNHLGGQKKGDIVTCVGKPRGALAALVRFGQAKKTTSPKDDK